VLTGVPAYRGETPLLSADPPRARCSAWKNASCFWPYGAATPRLSNSCCLRQGHATKVCDSADDMARELALGAGTALITEESLASRIDRKLAEWLADQPPWSDFPFILLSTKRSGRRTTDASRWPSWATSSCWSGRIHGETLASAVSSSLRGPPPQYEARRHLVEMRSAEERLTQMNGSLETRIQARTEELSEANNG
jgi:hypothetical protein